VSSVTSPFGRLIPYRLLALVVINPSLRMSWVQKHWDEDYMEKAEAMILDKVCSSNLLLVITVRLKP
jgi:hypothetical protein